MCASWMGHQPLKRNESEDEWLAWMRVLPHVYTLLPPLRRDTWLNQCQVAASTRIIRHHSMFAPASADVSMSGCPRLCGVRAYMLRPERW